MTCYCCGEQATHREGYIPLCDDCAGAAFVAVGEADKLGWSTEATTRVFEFQCPMHGGWIPWDVLDVDWLKAKAHWKSAYPVKLESGRKAMVLDYEEVA